MISTLPAIQHRCEERYRHQAQEAINLERSMHDARDKAERIAKMEMERTAKIQDELMSRHPQVYSKENEIAR